MSNNRVTETMSKKALAEIYREAARVVERTGEMSCCAVRDIAKTADTTYKCPESNRYAKIFAPSMLDTAGCYHDLVKELPDEDRHGFRVLALCFAAAMVEAGDA